MKSTNELENLHDLFMSGEYKLVFTLCEGLPFSKVKFMEYLWSRHQIFGEMDINSCKGNYTFRYWRTKKSIGWDWTSEEYPNSNYNSSYPGIENTSLYDMFKSFINHIENE